LVSENSHPDCTPWSPSAEFASISSWRWFPLHETTSTGAYKQLVFANALPSLCKILFPLDLLKKYLLVLPHSILTFPPS
jgi:hypothetical protein